MLAGREKGGKSTLAGAAAAAVSSGNAFFGGKCVKGKVLIIALEESTFLFSQRLMKFGATPENVAIVSRGSYEGNIVEAILEAADEVQPDLIIWDTLGKFADVLFEKPIDPGNSAEWTRVLGIVEDIARQYGATLMLHHARKSDGKYRDSTAIGGGVDMILEMHGSGSDPRTIKGVGRFEFEDVKITFHGDHYTIERTEEAIAEDILEYVASHPRCGARELMEAIDGRAEVTTRIKQTLLEGGKIVNVSRNANKHEYMMVMR